MEWSNEEWVCFRRGDCTTAQFDFLAYINAKKNASWPGILSEEYIDYSQLNLEPSLLSQVWREIIEGCIIPFDLQERRRKLAKAYEMLKPYIEAHEAQAHKKITQPIQTFDEQDECDSSDDVEDEPENLA